MMRIIPHGPDAYLFRDGTHAPVGWLRARTIRFTGFATHRDAVAAAVQGGLALAAYMGGTTLHAMHTGPQVARPPGDGGDERAGVRLVHDGRHQWVFIDATRIARLVPPADVEVVASVEEVLACGGPSPAAQTPEASAFSLEFLFSEDVSFDACLTLAQVLYAAIHHHQLRPAHMRPAHMRPAHMRPAPPEAEPVQ
jgi:hypothetical protein